MNVPIIGGAQEAKPAEGLYYYHMPVLVQRRGRPVEAAAFESSFPMPMNGVHFKQAETEIAKSLVQQQPDLPPPIVVMLSPVFLWFIPQEELDRQESARAAAAASPNTPDEKKEG